MGKGLQEGQCVAEMDGIKRYIAGWQFDDTGCGGGAPCDAPGAQVMD